eukprot:12881894-Prorocentrum_lima.AAC.1
MEAQKKALLEAEMKMSAALLESTRKPVRTYAVVTDWVQTFSFTPARPRHKVLVVNGPTCLGKT